MSSPRILAAGVGNIFLGDDAFGVEVVRALTKRRLPAGVRVCDFGARRLDLTYALLDGYETVILIDIARRGDEPGTLHVLEVEPPDANGEDMAEPAVEARNLDPARIFRLAAVLGCTVRRLLVVGCEPSTSHDEEMAEGLSDPVRAAVPEAVELVESLLVDLIANRSEAVSNMEIESCRK